MEGADDGEQWEVGANDMEREGAVSGRAIDDSEQRERWSRLRRPAKGLKQMM